VEEQLRQGQVLHLVPLNLVDLEEEVLIAVQYHTLEVLEHQVKETMEVTEHKTADPTYIWVVAVVVQVLLEVLQAFQQKQQVVEEMVLLRQFLELQ
jgi:hypothetical protein